MTESNKDEGVRYTHIPSPLGDVLVGVQGDALVCVSFQEGGAPVVVSPDWKHRPRLDHPVVEQLEAYFRGTRREFEVRLRLTGTPFQLRVWEALQTIPFGATASYRDVAVKIGSPRAVRAVGAANARNPVPVVIPCHRVIGSDGRLTGFRGGVHLKEFLLKHEAKRQ